MLVLLMVFEFLLYHGLDWFGWGTEQTFCFMDVDDNDGRKAQLWERDNYNVRPRASRCASKDVLTRHPGTRSSKCSYSGMEAWLVMTLTPYIDTEALAGTE